MVRRCAYCGAKKEKPSNKSVRDWMKRSSVYCSKDCFYLSKYNDDAFGYLGRYLGMKGIKASDLAVALDRYYGITRRDLNIITYGGISRNSSKDGKNIPGEEIALRVSCAVSDLDPGMHLVDDLFFDYRMLLRADGVIRGEWVHGEIPLEAVLEYRKIPLDKFIDYVAKNYKNANWALNNNKPVGSEMRETVRFIQALQQTNMHGVVLKSKEVKSTMEWAVTLEKLASHEGKNRMSSNLAWRLSKYLDRWGRGYWGNFIDYRCLLPRYSPKDYLRGLKREMKRTRP